MCWLQLILINLLVFKYTVRACVYVAHNVLLICCCIFWKRRCSLIFISWILHTTKKENLKIASWLSDIWGNFLASVKTSILRNRESLFFFLWNSCENVAAVHILWIILVYSNGIDSSVNTCKINLLSLITNLSSFKLFIWNLRCNSKRRQATAATS